MYICISCTCPNNDDKTSVDSTQTNHDIDTSPRHGLLAPLIRGHNTAPPNLTVLLAVYVYRSAKKLQVVFCSSPSRWCCTPVRGEEMRWRPLYKSMGEILILFESEAAH